MRAKENLKWRARVSPSRGRDSTMDSTCRLHSPPTRFCRPERPPKLASYSPAASEFCTGHHVPMVGVGIVPE
eukprot:6979521-Prymnesium_polylepis.1